MVAICDHLEFLVNAQLKHEVLGESVDVTLDLLVQALGGYSV